MEIRLAAHMLLSSYLELGLLFAECIVIVVSFCFLAGSLQILINKFL